VARILIVGCGCRGRALAGELLAAGHAVRGTTRDAGRLEAIEATGAEGVVADPDRLGTLMGQFAGVSVICWLMGSAAGDGVAELHGPRLRTMLERLVDTPVRGVVYEAAGSVDADVLAGGAAAVREAAATWRMPAQLVEADPADHAGWLRAMTAAVAAVL
jgi:nucleoside-diphosphate-sugar epimerase